MLAFAPASHRPALLPRDAVSPALAEQTAALLCDFAAVRREAEPRAGEWRRRPAPVIDFEQGRSVALHRRREVARMQRGLKPLRLRA